MRTLRPSAIFDASPLRRMEWLLLLLTLAAVVVWLAPPFQLLRGVPLMPLWLHSMMELLSIVIAMLLFGIVWNAYSRERSGNVVILGCAALAVGLIDLAHMLSYKGMPDFITPAGPEKGINFWLAARALAALSLLVVACRPARPLARAYTRHVLLAFFLALTALVYWVGLFRPHWLPDTFIEGVGLTSTKVFAEWAIVAVLAASAVLLHRRARKEGSYGTAKFFGVAVIGILSELCFTAYVSVNDIYNLFGHLLKIIAYLFLYRAAFVASVREPFRKLHVEVGERQRAEEALRELNQSLELRVAQRTQQLEQANRELESFSYSVSHDLRAPLRAIDGFSQILSKNYEGVLDERGKDYLGRVRRASQRMGDLIDDILHLSRVSRWEVVRTRVDVTQLAHAIADELKQADANRQVAFAIAPGMTLDADAKLVRIALENLMGNAWKFTGKTPAPRIEVGAMADGEDTAIFVRDNGAGFNMEYAHKLFNAFQRLHSSNEFDGTGIGLATVQRVARLHGGRAWAEGKEGEGATFYFSCGLRMEETSR